VQSPANQVLDLKGFLLMHLDNTKHVFTQKLNSDCVFAHLIRVLYDIGAAKSARDCKGLFLEG